MKASNSILIILLLLVMISCKNTVPRDEYVQWMENKDNGLKQVKKLGDVMLTLQYKSADYVIAKMPTPTIEISDDINQIKTEMENSILFDLSITCPDGGPLKYKVADINEMNERYHYYHFNMADDIYMESGTEKIKPLYCIADKGSGLTNTITFAIAFKKKTKEDTDFKLVIDDTHLGTGTTKFLIKSDNLENIPSIQN